MSDYIANKGFVALFALLAVLHVAWGGYEWWWLLQVDRGDIAGSILQFKVRWTAPILTTLAMSAVTLSCMVVRNPVAAMVMSLWYLAIALGCHLGLLYFDPLRNYQAFAHWVPAIALGILTYKIAKRYTLSQ